MMKRILQSFDLPGGQSLLRFLLTVMVIPMACHKDDMKIVPPPISKGPVYHVHFQFHGSGAPIPGIQAAAGYFRQLPDTLMFEYMGPVGVDQDGDVRFVPSPDHRYLKVQNIPYDEDLYEVDTIQVDDAPMHRYLESEGWNVVSAKWTHRIGNDHYFTADVYQRPYVDLHLVQVSDILPYATQNVLHFQADLTGMDTGRIQNTFRTPNIIPLIQWSPGRTRLDTTVRISGFAGVQNMLNWTVFADSLVHDTTYIASYNTDYMIYTPRTQGLKQWFIQGRDSSSTLTISF
jgi:hypothetical protein